MRRFEPEDHRSLATWSLDCAERVLPLFEMARPGDDRPRNAIETGRTWVRTGAFRMAVIRTASLGAHAAARDAHGSPVAVAAARAAGQAVATAHVAQHAYGGALYALRAIAADGDPVTALDRVQAEWAWQASHLPDALRHVVMDRLVVEERRAGPFVTVHKGPGF